MGVLMTSRTEHIASTFDLGAPVDVWCPSNEEWSLGFRVDGVETDGIRVRRISDGALLPAVFAPDHVRLAAPAHVHRVPRRSHWS
jgi:hypothetical protein